MVFERWIMNREDRPRTISAPGCRMKQNYRIHFDKNGKKDLIPDGFTDIYEEIQSFKDSVDINVILAKYAAGELSALNQKEGVFIDTTKFKDMDVPGLLNLSQRATDYFNQLPASEKEKFGNDPMQYFTAIVEYSKRSGDTDVKHSEVIKDADTSAPASKEVE